MLQSNILTIADNFPASVPVYFDMDCRFFPFLTCDLGAGCFFLCDALETIVSSHYNQQFVSASNLRLADNYPALSDNFAVAVSNLEDYFL